MGHFRIVIGQDAAFGDTLDLYLVAGDREVLLNSSKENPAHMGRDELMDTVGGLLNEAILWKKALGTAIPVNVDGSVFDRAEEIEEDFSNILGDFIRKAV